jgi:hypothetical protein
MLLDNMEFDAIGEGNQPVSPTIYRGLNHEGVRGHDISWFYAEAEERSMPNFFMRLRSVLG